MQIFFTVLGVLSLLIALILCLPVYIIVKNDDNNALIFRFRFLFKTFGNSPSPGSPVGGALRKSIGVQRFEKHSIQKNIRKNGLFATVSDSLQTLRGLLEQLSRALGGCTVKRFQLHILHTSEDPAEAAKACGIYCGLVYPFLGLLNTKLKIPESSRDIHISWAFPPTPRVFRYDLVIRVRVFYLVRSLLGILRAQMRRSRRKEPPAHG